MQYLLYINLGYIYIILLFYMISNYSSKIIYYCALVILLLPDWSTCTENRLLASLLCGGLSIYPSTVIIIPS